MRKTPLFSNPFANNNKDSIARTGAIALFADRLHVERRSFREKARAMERVNLLSDDGERMVVHASDARHVNIVEAKDFASAGQWGVRGKLQYTEHTQQKTGLFPTRTRRRRAVRGRTSFTMFVRFA